MKYFSFLFSVILLAGSAGAVSAATLGENLLGGGFSITGVGNLNAATLTIGTQTINGAANIVGNVNISGDIYANNLGGANPISAGNVSAGSFGSLTGVGNYIFPSSVGIGTTNPPVASLEISKAVAGQSSMLVLRNTNQNTGDTADIEFRITSGGAMARIGAIRTNAVASGDTDITFATLSGVGLTEKMRITAQGNVGIGTTGPGRKLDISQTTAGAGGILVAMPTAAETTASGIRVSGYSPAIELMDKDGVQNWHLSIDDNVNNDFVIGKGYGPGQGIANNIRIVASNNDIIFGEIGGNVGIGITIPYSKLGISGADTDPSAIHGATALLNIDNNLTDLAFTIDTTAPFAASIQHRHKTLDSNLYPIALNPLGGNVGIGTTAPGYKLDVAGTINATDIKMGGVSIPAASNIPSTNVTNTWTVNQTFSTGITVSGGTVSLPAGSIGTAMIVDSAVTTAKIAPQTSVAWAGNVTDETGSGALVFANAPTFTSQTNFDTVKITGGVPGAGKVLTSDASGLATWTALPASGVSSVFGRTGAVVAASGDYTTTQVTEGSNLYFTNARAVAAITGGASSIATANLTANRALLSDASGKVGVSSITNTELGYLSGVTSNIQTQLNAKASLPINAGDVSAGSFGSLTGGGNYIFSGLVGIGIPLPAAKLDVDGTMRANGYPGLQLTHANAQIRFWGESGEKWVIGSTGAAGDDLIIAPISGIGPTLTAKTTGDFTIIGGSVGIGTTAPGYKLDVVSGGDTTARFGTASTDKIVVGGGAGKIDAGTVDPIYTIGGERYATYMAGMTGVKEETTGVFTMTHDDDNDKIYEYAIDFGKQKKGSDLWLFAKTTNLEKHFDEMAVLLTPEFDGRVWYEKDAGKNRLTIFATMTNDNDDDKKGGSLSSSKVMVSYRLTAPRFDAEKWSNSSDAEYEGHNLDELIK
ncbi:MAG: hypothetical protein AAB634_01405 [Patescibacteria group bacterium]